MPEGLVSEVEQGRELTDQQSVLRMTNTLSTLKLRNLNPQCAVTNV